MSLNKVLLIGTVDNTKKNSDSVWINLLIDYYTRRDGEYERKSFPIACQYLRRPYASNDRNWENLCGFSGGEWILVEGALQSADRGHYVRIDSVRVLSRKSALGKQKENTETQAEQEDQIPF